MTLKPDPHKDQSQRISKSALYHWIAQRISALALIPLGVWYVGMAIMFLTAPYEITYAWLSAPWTVIFTILFMLSMCYHGYLGMQVVWEDYVSHQATRQTLILITLLFSVIMAVLSIISILKIYIS